MLKGSSQETSGEEELTSDDQDVSWISWFCSLRGSEFFVEVDEAWIEDDFNLHGLSSIVPNYDYALDLILDRETDIQLSEEQAEMIEASAEMLYGLIHARYILTGRGLELMLDKYNNQDFGTCPRVFCEGQPLLPVGQSDLPRQSTVKLYCPRCQDIYFPKFSKHASTFQRLECCIILAYICFVCVEIDGAYFGTTFPHMFQQIYPELIPPRPRFSYVPRIFGFKVHKSSREVLTAKAPNKDDIE